MCILPMHSGLSFTRFSQRSHFSLSYNVITACCCCSAQGLRITTSEGAPTPGEFVQAVLDQLTPALSARPVASPSTPGGQTAKEKLMEMR